MTCKDCIHYDVCKEDLSFNNLDIDKGIYYENCKDLKNKADIVEVTHSEWKLYADGSGKCKNCNTHQKAVWDMNGWQNFCGHCGADMRGDAK